MQDPSAREDGLVSQNYDTVYVWKFKQFKTASGRRVICDWKKRFPSRRRQAIFDVFMDRIAKMNSWTVDDCKPIKNHPGCRELRWTAEKVEHRIFGYFGEKEFFMMVGCTHKQKIYDPSSAFDTLDDRKKAVANRTGQVDEYNVFWTPKSSQ